MKIVHVCMVDAYSEGWAYHRNVISEKNKSDGQDVTIITNKYKMGNLGENISGESCVEYTKTGIKIIRLDNVCFLDDRLGDKVHWSVGLLKSIKEENPDVLMVHNLQFIGLDSVIKYKKMNPKVKLIGDTHADKYNTYGGKHPKRSLFFQRYLYGPAIKRCYKYFDYFFYITEETKDFFEYSYNISLENALLMPLPAPIISKEQKEKCIQEVRKELGLDDKQLLFVHSGRMYEEKKTKLIFEALKRSDIHCKLLIFGSVPIEFEKEFDTLLRNEPRTEFRGWIESDELRKYLAAADLYLQPGSQSVTMQNALAAGTPIMIYPHKGYMDYCNGCEFLVENVEDIVSVFNKIKRDSVMLKKKSEEAYVIAEKLLNIERQTQYMYSDFEK